MGGILVLVSPRSPYVESILSCLDPRASGALASCSQRTKSRLSSRNGSSSSHCSSSRTSCPSGQHRIRKVHHSAPATRPVFHLLTGSCCSLVLNNDLVSDVFTLITERMLILTPADLETLEHDPEEWVIAETAQNEQWTYNLRVRSLSF